MADRLHAAPSGADHELAYYDTRRWCSSRSPNLGIVCKLPVDHAGDHRGGGFIGGTPCIAWPKPGGAA